MTMDKLLGQMKLTIAHAKTIQAELWARRDWKAAADAQRAYEHLESAMKKSTVYSIEELKKAHSR